MLLIPKELFVGLQARPAGNGIVSADGGKNVALGFATYKNVEGIYQHEEAVNRWKDPSMPRFLFDNVPMTGFSVAGSVSRWSTSNKFIRVEDPRGFQLEIPIENFIEVIRDCTLIKGVIQDEMIWGWSDSKVRLFKAGSPNHNLGIDNFEMKGLKAISIKDLQLGNKVRFNNGDTAHYLGVWHVLQDDYHDEIVRDLLINKSISRDYVSGRLFFLEDENGKIYTVKSIVPKRIIDDTNFTKEEVMKKLQDRCDETIKYRIMSYNAEKEIKDKKLEVWRNKQEVESIYINAGLNSKGTNFFGNDSYRSYLDDEILAFNDKTIKNDFIKAFVEKHT